VDLFIHFRITLVSNICPVYCLTPTKWMMDDGTNVVADFRLSV
jgi:hypothetical protein